MRPIHSAVIVKKTPSAGGSVSVLLWARPANFRSEAVKNFPWKDGYMPNITLGGREFEVPARYKLRDLQVVATALAKMNTMGSEGVILGAAEVVKAALISKYPEVSEFLENAEIDASELNAAFTAVVDSTGFVTEPNPPTPGQIYPTL